ncbi:hypothetical protein ALC57_17781 [Trachymyrmex cornetzi]|uniref:Uncharacterized protein n=1 Tax=Trachymyrmex cornetzi TaxID=471704 RepID=A0A195DB44_9HYME|nr:hypothetical protein ALC57_17781 [Trachymyrmex cornetzi]
MALPLEIDRSNVDGTRETPAVHRGIIELMLLKYLRVLRDRAADWDIKIQLEQKKYQNWSKVHNLFLHTVTLLTRFALHAYTRIQHYFVAFKNIRHFFSFARYKKNCNYSTFKIIKTMHRLWNMIYFQKAHSVKETYKGIMDKNLKIMNRMTQQSIATENVNTSSYHDDINRQAKESSDEIKRDCTSWFVLPYVPKISDEFKRISKTFNTKLAFTSLNKLNSLIKGHKDILPRETRKNVVYKISCKSCDASYVGHSKRKLKLERKILLMYILHYHPQLHFKEFDDVEACTSFSGNCCKHRNREKEPSRCPAMETIFNCSLCVFRLDVETKDRSSLPAIVVIDRRYARATFGRRPRRKKFKGEHATSCNSEDKTWTYTSIVATGLLLTIAIIDAHAIPSYAETLSYGFPLCPVNIGLMRTHQYGCRCVSSYLTSDETSCHNIDRDKASCRSGSAGEY